IINTDDSFRYADTLRELDENGVAVIPGVMSADQCDIHIAELHHWIDGFQGGFPDQFSSIIHKYNIAHCPAAWSARLAAKPVFAGLWGTEKLLTSTDGIALAQPPELQGSGEFWKEGDYTGLHHDQGRDRYGLHCYQGALYLEDAEEDDYCFMVIEKSHQFHTEYFKRIPEHRKGEFRKLDKGSIDWFKQQGCRIRRVPCPKGGMIVWDSRTVHAGAPPKVGRENPRWRYVMFVCMGPAAWATPEDLKLKEEAYEKLRVSRHPPCNGVSLFSSKHTSKHDFTELPEIAKSKEAMQLAGVKSYDFGDGQSNGPKAPEWKSTPGHQGAVKKGQRGK
ncbi:hypothetical protein CAPTEDRAFT_130395, partial [Capitella teleta]